MMIDNKNHYRNDDDDNITIKHDNYAPPIITSNNINNSNNNDTIIIPNSFLTYFFNFDSLLPQGRLNGFQNMLTLINGLVLSRSRTNRQKIPKLFYFGFFAGVQPICFLFLNFYRSATLVAVFATHRLCIIDGL